MTCRSPARPTGTMNSVRRPIFGCVMTQVPWAGAFPAANRKTRLNRLGSPFGALGRSSIAASVRDVPAHGDVNEKRWPLYGAKLVRLSVLAADASGATRTVDSGMAA